jgi:hypothetical protein
MKPSRIRAICRSHNPFTPSSVLWQHFVLPYRLSYHQRPLSVSTTVRSPDVSTFSVESTPRVSDAPVVIPVGDPKDATSTPNLPSSSAGDTGPQINLYKDGQDDRPTAHEKIKDDSRGSVVRNTRLANLRGEDYVGVSIWPGGVESTGKQYRAPWLPEINKSRNDKTLTALERYACRPWSLDSCYLHICPKTFNRDRKVSRLHDSVPG